MTIRFQTVLVAAGTLALACSGAPSSAYAQWTVEDPWNLAYNVKHYTEVIQQVSMQVQQLKAQLAAMQRLAEYPGRALQPSLQSLTNIMGQPNSLGYAAPNANATFQRYNTPTAVIPNWTAAQTASTQAVVGVMQQAMAASTAQQNTMAPGAAAITRMQQLNTGLTGHEQALELQNSALIYTAQELMLVRQQLMTQVNLQAAYYAHELAERAQADTTVRTYLANFITPYTPVQNYSFHIDP